MTPRQRTGVWLIVASLVVWGLIFLLPLTDLSTRHKAMAGVGLYVLSYLVFFLGLRLLGRKLWDELKDRARRRLRRGGGSG